jgi:BNR repeat-like domain
VRRLLLACTATALAAAWCAVPAPAAVGPPVQASGLSPFAPNCHGAPQNGTLYVNSEVEPWVDVNPTAAGNLIGVYQQDRFETGGASGLGTSVSMDGGATWERLALAAEPRFSRCMGAAPGSVADYERATDPWVSFGPDGDAYQISLSFNDTRNLANAILVSESKDGGRSWSAPIQIIRDTDPNVFNDKETITADWTNPSFVYAIWDRLVFPQERAGGVSFLTAAAFRGPAWFARSTDGGASWEPARPIFDPGQNDQTIGNQIVVMPDGDLVDVTTVFRNDNAAKRQNGFVSALRSTNKGASWSGEIPISRLGTVEVHDPETGALIRTGDIIPQVASDERAGTDNVYVVWQDARFTGFQRDQIAFSKSTNGGVTWSEPVRINNRQFATQTFTPAVRVDADGNIAVVYHDFRNDRLGDARLDTDVWMVRSTDGGATWREERVTDTPFDMRTAPVARGFFTGDYIGLAAAGTTFHPFWSASESDADGTDAFGAVATTPFGGELIVPDRAPAGLRAQDFPRQTGKPTPR